MEGFPAVRVVRQIKLIRCQSEEVTPCVNGPSQESLPQLPEKNKRGLNAVFLLTTYTLGIGSIIIGALHFHDCPAQENLPACLIGFGVIVMIQRVLNCTCDFRNVLEEENTESVPQWLDWLNVLFLLANIGMFLTVCQLTFSMHSTTQTEDSGLENYCHFILYQTSFYGCGIGIVLFVVPILCACCVGLFAPL